MRKRIVYVPQSGFITGFIAAVVLAPGSPLWQVAAAAVLGVLSKHLIRFQHRQVFNPAAVGLAAVVVVAGAIDGWWGDDTPWLVALLGAFIVTRTRKWPTVAAFVAAWLLAAAVRSPSAHALVGAVSTLPLFFIAVMLIEPMTTPVRARTQVIYGLIAGGVASALAGALVVSLLAANLTVPLFNRFLRSAVPVV